MVGEHQIVPLWVCLFIAILPALFTIPIDFGVCGFMNDG